MNKAFRKKFKAMVGMAEELKDEAEGMLATGLGEMDQEYEKEIQKTKRSRKMKNDEKDERIDNLRGEKNNIHHINQMKNSMMDKGDVEGLKGLLVTLKNIRNGG